nr:PREDICTED: SHC SH2 domain-binding protein 1-like protein [Lepisosteus oculatus]
MFLNGAPSSPKHGPLTGGTADQNAERGSEEGENMKPDAAEAPQQCPGVRAAGVETGSETPGLHPKTAVRRRLLTPSPEGEGCAETTQQALNLPPVYISSHRFSHVERAALFCDQILGQCKAEDADEALSNYLIKNLATNSSWIGVWKTNPEYFFRNCEDGQIPYVGILVEVNSKPCQEMLPPLRVTVSIVEPFSSNISNLPRELAEEILKEHDYCVPVLDVYPIEGLDSSMKNIAQALENARFFYDVLWRDWDDEEECEEYAGVIEKRLQLYYDIQDGTIPGPIGTRFKKTLEEYRNKQLELTEYQSTIGDDPLPIEAVECWKKHYEILMLARFLRLWEDLRLRAHGPFFPRIFKRRKGQRASGKIVNHIVTQIMTADMIKNLSADTLIQQHDSLSAALDSCFSGDIVMVFPGKYQAAALSCLVDDITIQGTQNQKDAVIFSDPTHDTFIASKASNVTLMNLTLVQRETCDGIIVVESGQMTLENCILKCEGTGICVLTGATLVMKNCEIFGAQGAGVELYPGSVAELEGNNIHHCSNFKTSNFKDILKTSLGGISVKVLPEPKLKMRNNYIHNNQGYGVTIIGPNNLCQIHEDDLEQLSSGDQRETDLLSKAIQNLSLEINTNKLEANTMGDIGCLHNISASS